MSHAITNSDGLLLVGEPAWHGLGLVLPEAPSVREGIRKALPWEVRERPLWTAPKGNPHRLISCPGKAIVRVDTDLSGEETLTPLSVVGHNYNLFDVGRFTELCEALEVASQGRATLETVGSHSGGKRIWCLLKVKEYEPIPGDPTTAYFAVFNSFDGTSALWPTGTQTRVVCKNTETAALKTAEAGGAGLRIPHDSKLDDAVAKLMANLEVHGTLLDAREAEERTMAKRQLTDKQVRDTFVDMFVAGFGPEPEKGQAREDYRDRFDRIARRYAEAFEKDHLSRGTAYGALQAWTNVEDHRKNGDLKVPIRRLTGASVVRKTAARKVALALC